MEKYLRFGEIPVNEKSINFLKLNFSQKENFAWELENIGFEEAIKSIPENAFESGVSVFEMGRDGMPALHAMKEAVSLSCRIGDGLKIYQVSGDEVGRGNDGEPLIKNVKIEKSRRISAEKLEKHILSFLASNFCVSTPPKEEPDPEDYKIHRFSWCFQINIETRVTKRYLGFEEEGFIKCPEYTLFTFRGWEFAFPRPGFILDLATKKAGN